MRRRILVSGRVQGVFYRDSCRRRAAELGVLGWVANRDDGRVEAVFEGDDEAVAAMIAWARHGPAHARVRTVEVSEEEPTGEQDFRIR